MQPLSVKWLLPVLFLPSEHFSTLVLCSLSASHEIQSSLSSTYIHLFLPKFNPFFKIRSHVMKSFFIPHKMNMFLILLDLRAVWAFMPSHSALSCCYLCIFLISLPPHIRILNLWGSRVDLLLVLFIFELWGTMHKKSGRHSWVMRCWASAQWWEATLWRGAKFATLKCVSLAWRLIEADYFFFSVLFLCLCFWPHGLRDLSSPARDRPGPSAVKVPSPNHWTTREFPEAVFFFFFNIFIGV